MGDPRGFLKVRTRRELAERPVEERIKDWLDVHAESGLQPWTTEQAARCMDCGNPDTVVSRIACTGIAGVPIPPPFCPAVGIWAICPLSPSCPFMYFAASS